MYGFCGLFGLKSEAGESGVLGIRTPVAAVKGRSPNH